MGVPADACAVGQDLRHAPEELEGEGFLLPLKPIDGRGDRLYDPVQSPGPRRLFANAFDVREGDLDLLELHPLFLDAVDVHEDVEDRRPRARTAALGAPQDAVHDDALARRDRPGDVVLHVGLDALRLFPAAEDLWRLLGLDLLGVEVLRRLPQQLAFRARGRALAAALVLVALERLAERLPLLRLLDDRVAPQALERGVDDLPTEPRRLPPQPLRRHVRP